MCQLEHACQREPEQHLLIQLVFALRGYESPQPRATTRTTEIAKDSLADSSLMGATSLSNAAISRKVIGRTQSTAWAGKRASICFR